MQTSRYSKRQTFYPATPLASTSKQFPRDNRQFIEHQQYSPTMPPIPPPRIQSLINQNYPPKTTRFNKTDNADQPTSANLCTSNYRNLSETTSFKPIHDSQYSMLLQSSKLQQSLPPISTYLSTSSSIEVPRTMKTQDLSEEKASMEEALKVVGECFERMEMKAENGPKISTAFATSSHYYAVSADLQKLGTYFCSLLRFRFLLRLLRFLLFLILRNTLGLLSVFQ